MSRNPHKQMAAATRIVNGTSEVLTCAPGAADLVGRIPGGAVALAGDRILAVGSDAEIAAACDLSGVERIDAGGGIVIPGFVDCHTHLIFPESRVAEYSARVTGARPEELKRLGIPIGISATVRMLQNASQDELAESALDRLGHMLHYGTTTVESKSGYGLTVKGELRMLEINRRLQTDQPIDIVSTFLGAHAIPEDRSRESYIDEIIKEQIPAVVEAGLAEFNDVFCDEGYYTVGESRRILEAGLEKGLKAKIHTDEYSHRGGSKLAAELRAVSADHLNYTGDDEFALLRDARVIGVVMPGLDFAVGHCRPFNARAMMDAGMILALATDLCPGCWLESMPFVIQLACRLYKFSPEEALRAATYGAALALNREEEIGSLEPGKRADIAIFDLPQYRDLAYRLGRSGARTVIAAGNVVHTAVSQG